MITRRARYGLSLVSFFAAGVAISDSVIAQDRLPKMPGYENYLRMSREINAAARPLFQSSVSSVVWLASGNGFEYALGGKFYRYDFASGQRIEISALSAQPAEGGGPP